MGSTFSIFFGYKQVHFHYKSFKRTKAIHVVKSNPFQANNHILQKKQQIQLFFKRKSITYMFNPLFHTAQNLSTI
ncbi:hypothetical protein BDA96_01G501700 [Sorghum bicolor]|uniref:Alpha-carbonic anhydrase domain-containing protein n=1 Tax=Sorghum bicolor TaxID=4558 RepID=A0A921S6K6_SORBI|nr:hypothetical protein BDA96_01G501700 [Sorghum bicolor]